MGESHGWRLALGGGEEEPGGDQRVNDRARLRANRKSLEWRGLRKERRIEAARGGRQRPEAARESTLGRLRQRIDDLRHVGPKRRRGRGRFRGEFRNQVRRPSPACGWSRPTRRGTARECLSVP